MRLSTVWQRLVAGVRRLLVRERSLAREEARRETPASAPPPAPPATSAFDVLLMSGTTSLTIFKSGPVDPLGYYERTEVPGHHEVEFVTRSYPREASATAPDEEFRPLGVFKLAEPPLPIPALDELEHLADVFHGKLGLHSVPGATSILGAFVPHQVTRAGGARRLEPREPDRLFVRRAEGDLTNARVLAFVRRELRGVDWIAWVESAFPPADTGGPIVHRYYLDPGPQLWLVRDEPGVGKGLYRAELSRRAIQSIRTRAVREA